MAELPKDILVSMNKEICNIKRIVKGQSVTDGAGVKLNRIIASYDLDFIDPFVLLDELRSDNPDDFIAGFPTHPHRGIETITYMIHGNFRHKDSRGGGGLLTDGCVQWMTAGKGILHSEIPEQKDGKLWGYQLWLNLPKKHKMVEPRYQHLSPETIPHVDKKGMSVNIISGEYEEIRGCASNWVKTHYFDVRLSKGVVFTFKLEPGMNSCCYVHSGEVSICDKTVEQNNLVEFDNKTSLEITGSSEDAGFLFLAGMPNNEPIARGGPFVMNTREEIDQAFKDYRNGVLF
jgi:redox-sensitive bicupin YhaK (pirin superfamily)